MQHEIRRIPQIVSELTFRRQSVAAQWGRVSLHSVEARGDQHNVRGKLVGDGHHHGPESGRAECYGSAE